MPELPRPTYGEAQVRMSHALEALQQLPPESLSLEHAHLLSLYTAQMREAIAKAMVTR